MGATVGPLQGIPVSIKDLEGQKQPDLLALRLSRKTSRFFMPVSLAVDTGYARNTPAFLVTIH